MARSGAVARRAPWRVAASLPRRRLRRRLLHVLLLVLRPSPRRALRAAGRAVGQRAVRCRWCTPAPDGDPHTFYISGGLEPLTNPGLGELVRAGAARGFKLSLYTNGFMLTPHLLQKQPGLWDLDTLRISLYGANPAEAARVTQHDKAYDQVRRNAGQYLRLRNERRAATKFGFNFVLLHDHADQVLDIVEMIAEINREAQDAGGTRRQVDFLTLREDYSVPPDRGLSDDERGAPGRDVRRAEGPPPPRGPAPICTSTSATRSIPKARASSASRSRWSTTPTCGRSAIPRSPSRSICSATSISIARPRSSNVQARGATSSAGSRRRDRSKTSCAEFLASGRHHRAAARRDALLRHLRSRRHQAPESGGRGRALRRAVRAWAGARSPPARGGPSLAAVSEAVRRRSRLQRARHDRADRRGDPRRAAARPRPRDRDRRRLLDRRHARHPRRSSRSSPGIRVIHHEHEPGQGRRAAHRLRGRRPATS